jgi:hypothetical protein
VLKTEVTASPRAAGYEIGNYGVFQLSTDDDNRSPTTPVGEGLALETGNNQPCQP